MNRLGFIETPYREVKKGKVDLKSKPIYLSAEEEDNKYIAQANADIDKDGNFQNERVISRFMGDFPLPPKEDINLIDVGTNQIASIAASCIPFWSMMMLTEH